MNLREIWLSGGQWPVALWLISLVATALLVRWLYHRVYAGQPARHLWWLRFAAVALTLVALADLTRKEFQVELPWLVIAIDNSTSANLPNDPSQPSTSRLDMIRTILDSDRIERLSSQYRLSFWQIGNVAKRMEVETFPQQLDGSQTSSELGDTLSDVIQRQSGNNTTGILVFSDGATTSGSSLYEAGKLAAEQNLPVIVAGTGNPRLPENISVDQVTSNKRVRVGEPLRLTFDLHADSANGQSIEISVNDNDSGLELGKQTVVANGKRFRRTISLPVVLNEPGSRKVVVSAQRSGGSTNFIETNPDDNQVETMVQVVEGKTRVLIVQDLPNPWFRFIKKSLVRATDVETGQRAFEVRTLLQNASTDYAETDETALNQFPSMSELAEFDLVVIGDVRHDSLGRSRGLSKNIFQNLKEYVLSHSGNVVFVPGPQHYQQLFSQQDALGLLPKFSNPVVSSESDQSSLRFETAADSFGPARWLKDNLDRQTPLGFAIWATTDSGIVLATFGVDDHSGTPPDAITLQRIGGGTVITHFSNELYKLRFRSEKNLFENYWVRMVTELSAERLQKRDAFALLKTDASKYQQGESITVTADIFTPSIDTQTNDTIPVLLTGPNGQTTNLLLRQSAENSARYQITTTQTTAGNYQLKLASTNFDLVFDSTDVAANFVVEGAVSESSIQNQQVEALSQLATQSGGVFLDIREADQIWTRLPRGGWNQIGASRLQPIWNSKVWPVLFALFVLGLLVAEWLLRRKLRLE